MTVQQTDEDYQSDRQSAPGAPTLRAVVGSHRIEEEMFGKVFDQKIMARIGAFVVPYRRDFGISIGAVLIFDDSTAAVDANTEARIRAALAKGAATRVTLIVAHRLNSLLHADRILFLDKGRVVEQGSHADLLALNGRYRALYDLQTNAADREGL